jgi:hypothetical protein
MDNTYKYGYVKYHCMENECAFITFTDASYAIAYSRYEGLVVEGEIKNMKGDSCL